MEYLILDADETLYPPSCGLFSALRERARQFIQKNLSIPEEQLDQKVAHYVRNYGTILTGLLNEERIDPNEFNAYVFDVSIRDYIQPNQLLKKTLRDYPQIKTVVFSNSPLPYLEGLLNCLEIRSEIFAIFDRTFMNYLSKPNPKVFEMVTRELNTSGDECILVDDMEYNLEMAKQFGMATVFIYYGEKSTKSFIDHQIKAIHEIGKILAHYSYSARE